MTRFAAEQREERGLATSEAGERAALIPIVRRGSGSVKVLKSRGPALFLRNVICAGNSGHFGVTKWLGNERIEFLYPARPGHPFARLRGGTPGGRHVRTGTRIEMLGQASGAQMELMNPAMDDRNIASAKLTATSRAGSGRIFGRAGIPLQLQQLRFEVKPASHEQGAHTKNRSAQPQQAGIVMLSQSGRQATQTDEHYDRAKRDQPVAHPCCHSQPFLVRDPLREPEVSCLRQP